MQITVYSDGASLGNPGKMGAGVVLLNGEETVRELSVPLGHGTNNRAELSAILLGLKEAQKLKASSVLVRMDSEWSSKILSGEYKLKKEELRPLVKEILELAASFDVVEYEWIPREGNSRADELSKEAALKN